MEQFETWVRAQTYNKVLSSMKYQEGQSYQILNSETVDVYVGSTCQRLFKRMANHKTQLKSGKVLHLYEKMRETGDGKFYIELIEDYPCENSEQ